jgi:hypothetical protein
MARKITKAERDMPQTRRKLSPAEIAANEAQALTPEQAAVSAANAAARNMAAYGTESPSEGDILKRIASAQAGDVPNIPKTLTAEQEARVQAEVKKQQLIKPGATEPVKPGTELAATENKKSIIEEIIGKNAARGSDATLFGKSTESYQQAITQGVEQGLQNAAQVIDMVTSTLSARKQADVITAESSLNDALAQIGRDIQLVKNGLKPAYEVKASFRLANNALGRLESSQKGTGKLNLRYWLGGGKEIETEVLITKQRMQDLWQELLIAEQTGRATEQLQQAIQTQQIRGSVK